MLLEAPEPQYSPDARQQYITANLLAYLIVGETGAPTDLKMKRGVGCGLDDKRWRGQEVSIETRHGGRRTRKT